MYTWEGIVLFPFVDEQCPLANVAKVAGSCSKRININIEDVNIVRLRMLIAVDLY